MFYRAQSAPLFIYSWRENSWMRTFAKWISAKRYTNSLIQDLNSDHRAYFLRQQLSHVEHPPCLSLFHSLSLYLSIYLSIYLYIYLYIYIYICMYTCVYVHMRMQYFYFNFQNHFAIGIAFLIKKKRREFIIRMIDIKTFDQCNASR